MASIPFVKATACGNDFLIIDSLTHRATFTRSPGKSAIATTALEPTVSSGCCPPRTPTFAVRLLNADGSEAEISGNGTRCVAAWYCFENHRDSVVIRTGAGLKTCELKAQDGNNFEFRSSMGEPEVGDDFSIKVAYGEVTGTPVSMGNPHYVVFVSGVRAGWQASRPSRSRQHQRVSSTE